MNSPFSKKAEQVSRKSIIFIVLLYAHNAEYPDINYVYAGQHVSSLI